MVTLKEIAESCNVSIATVSNILNGKANVSDETRERILQVVKETGYKPNYLARHLRATKTNSIGIIIDDLTEFSSPSIIDGIMSFLEENGYKTVLENLRFYSKWGTNWFHNKEYEHAVDEAIRQLSAIKVDGIIYVAGHSRNINCLPENPEVPTVLSYAFTENKNISSVEIDDVTSAYKVTEYLIKNGHKKISFIGGLPDNIHTQRRLEGTKKALADYNISFNDNNVQYGDWKSDTGYEACKKIIEAKDGTTAIFCFNDIMAAGAYNYLETTGNTAGENISIVGFDNRAVSSFLKPALTTMEIPLYALGRKSGELVLQKINEPDKTEKQELLVSCTLIERKSVKKI